MGDRPVGVPAGAARGPPTPSGSWRLVPEHARRAQGLVASAFGHLPAAAALFLEQPHGAGGAWIAALRQRVPITDATGKTPAAAALAFTWSGLAAMRLDEEALATFSTPFREGMHQVDRRRRLSDLPGGGTVIDGGPIWSANVPDPYAGEAGGATPPTAVTVHALLLLYAADEGALAAQRAAAEEALRPHRVRAVRTLRLTLRVDDAGVPREHFGFADGMSQPVPFGDAIVPPTWPGAAEERRWHGVPAGEILMGHPNAHREPAPGPIVAASPEARETLPASGAPEGFLDLGLDGSYLVVRELRQDVAAFWRSMEAAARALDDARIDATWVAERVVGRTRDGDPLAPGGTLPREGGERANDFGYAERDPHGLGCPLGAHIRRANPRDSLPSRDGFRPSLDHAPALLASANGHRVLRRGRKFGPDIADPRADDGADRGLLFLCLNTDIARQFEFVQQTWLLNQAFATLFDETDPLLGPRGRFTIPATPVRLRPAVETYVRLAGGEYFFLPSLPALDYLARLPVAAP
jgi:Dyp-type peroxidase family